MCVQCVLVVVDVCYCIGLEIFGDDVGFFEQCVEYVVIGWIFQVECDVFFVVVE